MLHLLKNRTLIQIMSLSKIDNSDEDKNDQQCNKNYDEHYVAAENNNLNGETHGTKSLPWSSSEFDIRVSDEEEGGSNANGKVAATKKTRASRYISKSKRYGDIASLAFMTADSLYGRESDEEQISAIDALCGRNRSKWVTSMADETESMIDNQVFEIEANQEGRKLVACRWVFASKKDLCREIIRCMPLLVAEGFSQVKGVD